jgi:hypothetical protein
MSNSQKGTGAAIDTDRDPHAFAEIHFRFRRLAPASMGASKPTGAPAAPREINDVLGRPASKPRRTTAFFRNGRPGASRGVYCFREEGLPT